MLFTAIYASPNERMRHRIWELLYNISLETNEPWLLAGDFNEIKSPLEQKGGGRVNEARCRNFNGWIQDCNLIDLEANGPFFTWKGPKWKGLDRVHKRLDRCLCNVLWQERFVNVEVRVIPRVGSDHHPIVVKLYVDYGRHRERPFRYEVAWQLHEGFDEVIRSNWKGLEDLNGELSDVRQELQRWNSDVFVLLQSSSHGSAGEDKEDSEGRHPRPRQQLPPSDLVQNKVCTDEEEKSKLKRKRAHSPEAEDIDDITPWGCKTGLSVSLYDDQNPVCTDKEEKYILKRKRAHSPEAEDIDDITPWDCKTGLSLSLYEDRNPVCIDKEEKYILKRKRAHSPEAEDIDDITPWGCKTGLSLSLYDDRNPVCTDKEEKSILKRKRAHSPEAEDIDDTTPWGCKTGLSLSLYDDLNPVCTDKEEKSILKRKRAHSPEAEDIDDTTPWGCKTGLSLSLYDDLNVSITYMYLSST
ncbi:hypothetical protein K1719_004031 [Acacia pycnantha]|nr:hypothetical protein K1719_004031 [Acacia pycnantha]